MMISPPLAHLSILILLTLTLSSSTLLVRAFPPTTTATTPVGNATATTTTTTTDKQPTPIETTTTFTHYATDNRSPPPPSPPQPVTTTLTTLAPLITTTTTTKVTITQTAATTTTQAPAASTLLSAIISPQKNESFTQDQSTPWNNNDDDDPIESTAAFDGATLSNSSGKSHNQSTTTGGNQPVAASTTTTTQASQTISSQPPPPIVHPLLIYSVRHEIKSYDLLATPTSQLLARTLDTALNSTSISTKSIYNDDYSHQQHHHQPVSKHSKTLIAGLKNTIGLDFYYSDSESYIFWTDVIEERIYKGTIINATITNVEVVLQTGLATAEGLAIDWIGLNIYWVESTLDHIEVANMNGSSRRTLIAGDMESPRAIAVDPRYGLLFWTDWDKKSPRIERATMSGENRKTLVQIKKVNGGWPNGLTLDYEFRKVYWIDANSDSIHVVDYDGNNHQTLLKDIKSLGHPFSITLYESNLYWTDWKTNSVSMANKYDGSGAKELQKLSNRLFDIKVFHPSRQPQIDKRLNPCHINNGNCSHLCLLSLNHTRVCECPHLMKLAQDKKTCETYERVLLIGRTNEIRAVDISEPLHHIMALISVPKVFNPRQFEYDSKSRTIFWADSQTNEVKRAQLAGNSIETIIDVIIESPSGLALDWISGNIYVTSAPQQKSPGKIFISNLNGEYISILMDSSNGIISPKSIAVHPLLGLLFCVDENENSEPIIFAASMDGRHKRTIASKFNDPKLDYPSSLAIDYELNRVYWINQANNSSDNASIQYYDILRDTVVTILDESEVQPGDRISPGVLCVDGDYLIISGRIPTEAIMKVPKERLTERTILRTQNLDQLSALRVYNASSQVGKNACSNNNGGCSQLCVPTNSTHRTCKCTMGYSTSSHNETECMGKDLFLMFSYNLGMKGISLKPNSSPDDYFLPPIHRAFRASSIDYVHKENLIYWVDNEEGSITKINRDTTNYQIIVQGLESEESIAIDWVAGNIYWLDPYYDIIEVARLNGSNRYVIVSGDMDKANGIVVNPIKGYIVWSDIGSIPKIETARLDGSNRRMIVSTNLSHVDDLAIDYIEDYIYWVDSTLAIIERVKDDGSGRQVIYSSASNQSPHANHLVSIAIYKEHLYVADSAQNQGSIMRFYKNNASEREIIQQHLGDGIRDITIFAEQPIPSPEDNPCAKNNGGCQDLCLFMGKKGEKRCICSHGKLKSDLLTCEPYDTFILFSKLSQIDSLHIVNDESYNNSPYPPIAIENRSNIISLTVDYNAQRVIYSEITRDQICSMLFNGTDRRVLVEKQSLVEGIAFANDQLYWTSIDDNSISRLNTTSTGIKTETCSNEGCEIAKIEKIIKLGNEDKPRGIAVDGCTSYVYWTNWNSPNASIQRASPHSGYKIESIIKTNIKVPNGIAIDQKQRKLYWCDARLDKIEVCDMDGSNRLVLNLASPQHPFALAIWDNYVFWTDWLARGVFKADKYTGLHPVQIKKVVQRPMGIAVAAPEILDCPTDHCSVNNGGCPVGYTCVMHQSVTKLGGIVECRPHIDMLHESLPMPKCKHSKNGSWCDPMTYHDIIMDSMDRYNLTDLISLESKYSSTPLSIITETFGSNSTDFVGSSAAGVSTSTEQAMKFPTDTHHNATQNTPETNTTSSTNITPYASTPAQEISAVGVRMLPNNHHASSITTKSSPVISSTLLPPMTTPSKSPETLSTTTVRSLPVTTEQPIKMPQTSTLLLPTTPAPPTNNTTLPPCQIVPAALQPTTDASSNNDCKLPGQFKCYLSEKLVCIPGERRCDGNYDCPSKEDENDCYLSKRGPYNMKGDTIVFVAHKFVIVTMFILVVVIVALFLVFGNRGRRRWLVGSHGSFNHRRMFDDNGTNIEISNPMFDEDDSGNLVHCAFSIDLNERTTNFSNPLYERQVLLMTDKNVTSS